MVNVKRTFLEKEAENHFLKKYSSAEENSLKYTEESVRLTMEDFKSTKIDFIAGAKWQAKSMYSEEEVKHIISEALQSALVTVDLQQWFEQFKKK